jgi:hypothetical protein
MQENSGIQACTPYKELIPPDHHSRPSFAGANFSICLSSARPPCLRASTSSPHYSSSPTRLSSLGTLTSRCRWFSYHCQWSIRVCSGVTSGPSASAPPSASISSSIASGLIRHLVNERIPQPQLRFWRWFCIILSLTRRVYWELWHGFESHREFVVLPIIKYHFESRRFWIAATIRFGWAEGADVVVQGSWKY